MEQTSGQTSGMIAEARPTQDHVAPVEHIRQFFAWSHLPPHLAEVSRPFAILADEILNTLPRNPERTVALRKLLEAKDAAVRARLAK
jgi:hypothetical protein